MGPPAFGVACSLASRVMCAQDKVTGSAEEKEAAQKRFAEISAGELDAIARCGKGPHDPFEVDEIPWRTLLWLFYEDGGQGGRKVGKECGLQGLLVALLKAPDVCMRSL